MIRSRRVVVSSAAAFVLVASLLVGGGVGASSPTARSAGGGEKSGGEVVFGLEAETTNYCLSRAQLALAGIQVANSVYETLMVPNAQGEPSPYLAKSMRPNADNTEWTVKLRDGITFHDGTPLTAEVVKQNLDSWRGAPGASNSGPLLAIALRVVDDVVVDDTLTLRILLNTPVTDFDAAMSGDGRLGIMAPAQLNAGEECATKMLGTGPFKLEEYRQNEKTVVVRNPDYWQPGLPKLDRITFVPVVDGGVRVNQLQGGDLDVMHTSSALNIDALRKLGEEFNLLEEKPGYRQVRYYILLANNPPFDDAEAREAFALALDRDEINSIRNDGVFETANDLNDRKTPGYLKNAGYPKQDVERARELVESVKARTGSFTVSLGITTDPDNTAEAQLVKEQLDAVGIDAQIAQFDQATLINKALARDIDVIFWRNLHGGWANHQNTNTFVWFANADTGNILNFSGFNDDTTQALLEEGRAATDPAKIKRIYQDFNRAMADGGYVVPMWYSQWDIGMGPDVSLKFPPLPDGGTLLFQGVVPVNGLSKG